LPDRFRVMSLKWVLLLLGFFLLAYGSVMGIEASMGVAPWHVLHIGITNHLAVSVGRASQIVGFVVLALAVMLGVRPSLATWLNMFMIGFIMDFVIAFGLVPRSTSLAVRALYLVLGMLIMNLGITTTICAGLGAGPRDSLMLGVTRRTGWRVGAMKSFLECSVVGVGFILGGPVGLGTLFNAAVTGPVVERYMVLLERIRRSVPFLSDVIKLPSSVRIGGITPTVTQQAAPGGNT